MLDWNQIGEITKKILVYFKYILYFLHKPILLLKLDCFPLTISSLRVEKLHNSDIGQYLCVATNPSGTLNATAYLQLTSKSKHKSFCFSIL